LGKSFLCTFDNANRYDAYNTAANTKGPVHKAGNKQVRSLGLMSATSWRLCSCLYNNTEEA